VPLLVLAAATAWAAGGSGAALSRGSAGGWDAPLLLAQVTPPGGTEGEGEDDADEAFDPSDTLDVEERDPVTPDTTGNVPPPSAPQEGPDTTGVTPPPSPAPADTLHLPAAADTGAAAPDTLRGTFVPVNPDSVRAAARRAAAADSGVGDTLFMAKPRVTQGNQPPPATAQKKPRTGILGIHPIVILLGLAAAHYFVVKATGD
jgi:hypothetical protein